MNSSLAYAIAKWEDVKNGQRVIFSDETLDLLSEHFNPRPERDKEADLYFKDFVTVGNAKQVGVRDRYIGWIPHLDKKGTALYYEY